MKQFFKKKKSKLELCAALSGTLLPLEQVEDAIFAQKMMGDGVAIVPTGQVVVAPCAGKIVMISDTLHAFGLESEQGVEVLVHIGMDTSQLKGVGFSKLVEAGAHVEKGTPIISFDAAMLEAKGISLVTPMIILNAAGGTLHHVFNKAVVEAGQDVVLQLEF